MQPCHSCAPPSWPLHQAPSHRQVLHMKPYVPSYSTNCIPGPRTTPCTLHKSLPSRPCFWRWLGRPSWMLWWSIFSRCAACMHAPCVCCVWHALMPCILCMTCMPWCCATHGRNVIHVCCVCQRMPYMPACHVCLASMSCTPFPQPGPQHAGMPWCMQLRALHVCWPWVTQHHTSMCPEIHCYMQCHACCALLSTCVVCALLSLLSTCAVTCCVVPFSAPVQ